MAITPAITGSPTTRASHDALEREKKEIERLRSTHEWYDLFLPEWNFFLSAYEGGRAFVTKENVFRHAREHEDDYKERLRRAYYKNYCERLVDFFTEFILAETIQREGGSEAKFYNQFIQDVDLKGNDVNGFMNELSDDKDIFGIVYVLVDAPPKPTDQPVSKADEGRLGLRPYWVLVRPQEVLDWVCDKFGKFMYVKRVQFVTELRDNVRVKLERYTEWTPLDIKITEVDVTEAKKPRLYPSVTLTNEVREVPLVPFLYKPSKRFKGLGISFLRDLSFQNREVMNLDSLEQEFLYRQCFNILAQEVGAELPLAEQQEGEVGTSNFLYYPKGAHPPQYIAPDAAPADKIAAARQSLVNEMYRYAAQDTINELFNGGGSSGFSKSMSFSTTAPKIAARAEVLEDGEARLMMLTMKYLGRKWDGKIKYKDRYEITNLTDAITQLTSLFRDLGMPSATFAKHELKRLVHEYDGKIPADDLNRILAEVDQLNFVEWIKRVGPQEKGPKPSPAAQQKPKQTGTMQEVRAESDRRRAPKTTNKMRERR